jgi:hypothetical protein
MSSKSKKKDKKKSKTKNDKIELTEIEEATNPTRSDEDSADSSEASALEQKVGYKVKVFPALGAQTNKKYEDAASAALNSPDFDGYELLSVLPSSDSKKLVAFFKLSK